MYDKCKGKDIGNAINSSISYTPGNTRNKAVQHFEEWIRPIFSNDNKLRQALSSMECVAGVFFGG